MCWCLDTITYATTEFGIIRAEGAAFMISPSHSASAIAYLIDKTGTKHIIITPDVEPLADAVVAIMKERGLEIPVVRPMPAFSDLFPDGDSKDFEYLPAPKLKGLEDPACLLHSSGASGRFDLQTVYMTIVIFRVRWASKIGHFYESHLGLLLAFAVVRWP